MMPRKTHATYAVYIGSHHNLVRVAVLPSPKLAKHVRDFYLGRNIYARIATIHRKEVIFDD